MKRRMHNNSMICIMLVMTLMALSVATSSAAFAEEGISIEGAVGEAHRVDEVVELREKNSDTYLLSDGTYECVVYAEDKYYQTMDGELKEISNAIIRTEHKIKGATYSYANEAGSTRFYFENKTPSVLINHGNAQLSFSLMGGQTTRTEVGNKGNEYTFEDFNLNADNCITYLDACKSTDLVYSVHNGRLKEYIILKDANAPSSFQFAFNTEECYISENDLGTLDVYDCNGKLIFELAPLFAVDSAGKYTENVRYEIIKTSKDITVIGITIDTEYLSSAERAFPILVDPSIMVTGEWNTYDTYVSSRYPTTNYYLSDYLRTGRDEDFYIRRTYIKFDLPSSVIGSEITSAFIDIKKYSGSTPAVKAYRVTGSWSSSGLTWNNKPGYTTTNASLNATHYQSNWYRMYVTSIVRSWYAGTYNLF